MATKKTKVLKESELKRKYSTSGKADIMLPDENVIRLPSRVLPFNHQLGGGIPYGRMMELYGWESTGKSLLASDFAYATQYLNGQVLWADLENAWSNSWAEQQGLDVSKIELLQENNSIEHFSDWLMDMCVHYRSKLTNNEPILVVCDSIAGGETESNIAVSQVDRKAEMGNRAKAWDTMYRMRIISCIKKYGICVIMINQLRSKVGATMFEASTTTPGGKSTAFYASIRVGLHKGKQIKGYATSKGFKEDSGPHGKKVGQSVNTRVEKNKTAPPVDSVKTEVYFRDTKTGYVGYNKTLGLGDLAIDGKVITVAGNTYSYNGHKVAGKREDVDIAIANDVGLRKAICKKLNVNTITRTSEQLALITKNLYPVNQKMDTDE